MAHAEIELDDSGEVKLVIDGIDFSHADISFGLTVGQARPPRLTVDVPVEGLDAGIRAPLVVPPGTAELLVHMGWTPPADPE